MNAIADVARLAGVSKATASRALSGRGYVSEVTRERVRVAASDLGYIASPNAASLVTGRTKNVGVIIPFVGRWFFAEVLAGLERELLLAGYDLTLYNLTIDGAERSRIFDFFLARKRFDAVVAIGVELSSVEADRLHKLGRPVVAVGGAIAGATTFAIDDVGAARLATEHLISLGHSRIVHIGGDLAESDPDSVHGKRLLGFREAMQSAGLATTDAFRPTDFSMSGGHSAALQVLGDPRRRPTAVVAGCDEIAFGTILAAHKLGVDVPRALSITGIDGHEDSAMFGLTTVAQEPREQARLAVTAALRLIDDAPASAGMWDLRNDHLLPVELIVRSSTTRATASS